jgi:hypothetical protein
MGEKMAMLTQQRISHGVAKGVSEFLNPNRNDKKLDELAKKALAITGRIVRDNIYDFDK